MTRPDAIPAADVATVRRLLEHWAALAGEEDPAASIDAALTVLLVPAPAVRERAPATWRPTRERRGPMAGAFASCRPQEPRVGDASARGPIGLRLPTGIGPLVALVPQGIR